MPLPPRWKSGNTITSAATPSVTSQTCSRAQPRASRRSSTSTTTRTSSPHPTRTMRGSTSSSSLSVSTTSTRSATSRSSPRCSPAGTPAGSCAHSTTPKIFFSSVSRRVRTSPSTTARMGRAASTSPPWKTGRTKTIPGDSISEIPAGPVADNLRPPVMGMTGPARISSSPSTGESTLSAIPYLPSRACRFPQMTMTRLQEPP